MTNLHFYTLTVFTALTFFFTEYWFLPDKTLDSTDVKNLLLDIIVQLFSCQDLSREVDQLRVDVQDLERWRDRLLNSIYEGYVTGGDVRTKILYIFIIVIHEYISILEVIN